MKVYNEEQTPEHLLINCPLTSDLREENQLYLTNTKQVAFNKDQYIKFNRFCRMYISRLKSGHLRTMTFQNGCKVFPLCTKCNSQPATPRHIIDCIDSSIDELYSSPADTINKLYKLDTLIRKKKKKEYIKTNIFIVPFDYLHSLVRLDFFKNRGPLRSVYKKKSPMRDSNPSRWLSKFDGLYASLKAYVHSSSKIPIQRVYQQYHYKRKFQKCNITAIKVMNHGIYESIMVMMVTMLLPKRHTLFILVLLSFVFLIYNPNCVFYRNTHYNDNSQRNLQFYHNGVNTIVNTISVFVVVVSKEEPQMSPYISITVAAMSTILGVYTVFSSNVHYLGCVYCIVVVVVSKEEPQMSPYISITVAAMSTILGVYTVFSRNVHYLGCVYCIVVVVVSNEEPQMSPYISITVAAMSTILGVYTVFSRNVHYLGCVYCIVVVVVSNEEPQMSPYISITVAEMSTILGVYTVLLLLSSSNVHYLGCVYCIVVVVVSKEEPQMSPYISITVAAMSTILGVASDVSVHLYHSSSNVHYLGCVYCIVVVVVSKEEPPMSPYISITVAAMSTILGVYTVLLLLSSSNVHYLGCVYCIVVVVVSNEELQMSTYISITVAAMSTILGVYTVLLLLSCLKKSLRCLHTSPTQQQQCPLSWVCKAAALVLFIGKWVPLPHETETLDLDTKYFLYRYSDNTHEITNIHSLTKLKEVVPFSMYIGIVTIILKDITVTFIEDTRDNQYTLMDKT
ncbi:hypothetical protein LAZ67_22001794 [Cordylochernes scorpioides]|uniref:NADH dehydrogenase subunit 6 n=1 Tax=Cordylochernes scorpioides TaxID=51811 RepID=A0ABY6LP71_9ARAC|nr:hypothetical protein LAZ67_22001794 [Cordylochernes scorpioides]